MASSLSNAVKPKFRAIPKTSTRWWQRTASSTPSITSRQFAVRPPEGDRFSSHPSLQLYSGRLWKPCLVLTINLFP